MKSTSVEVVFRPRTSWSLPPYLPEAPKERAETGADGHANDFRWIRPTQATGIRASWQAAAQMGWIIPSPIDVRVTPIADREAAMTVSERAEFSRATGLRDFWVMGTEVDATGSRERLLLFDRPNWMRPYEANYDDEWAEMFYPLGEGFVEWRLGWQAEIPTGFFLMVVPLPDVPGIEVASGIIGHKKVDEMKKDFGMALAFRPTRPTSIARNQPLARLLLLHGDSVKAVAR